MPEGHTIHRLARDLAGGLAGHPVSVSSPQGRFAEGAALLDGTLLEGTDAHGKHLFLGFAGQRWVHVHLGLYGTFVIAPGEGPAPRGALRMRLQTETMYADLRGPTACELVTVSEKAALHARLGPDPLRRDADPSRAWAVISRSRTPIAALLLQQDVVAGIGNVYRAELLYRHRIPPLLPGRELPQEHWVALWEDLRTLMRAGVRAGRIVTTRPEHRPRRRGPVPREEAHYVYRRTGLPCRVCGTEVAVQEMAARNLYWCPHCQAA